MAEQGINRQIAHARRWAAISVLLNASLAAGKGLAGWASGSAALMGDAVHSATDVVGSSAALLGLWLAGRQHPSFPYGLYKAENLATLVSALAIVLAGYEIARHAILDEPTIPLVGVALPAAMISLLVTVSFGLLQLGQGRRLHSPALKADARDYLIDGLSTTLVIVGLLGAWLGLNLDRWAAAAVSCFVFWSGGQLLWRALCDLMDQAIDRETERALIRTAEEDPLVQGVERVLSRTAGGRFLVEMDVLPRTSSLQKAELLNKSLERKLLEKFPQLASVRVRARSMPKKRIRRFTPVQSPSGEMEAHLARAPWFCLQELDRESGQVLHEECLENPHGSAETKRGLLVGRWLLDLNPDQVVVAERKEGTAAALLEEAGVELVPRGRADV
jgi:cation diffusion facilitator family transporter